jgi:hypothetical protein
VEGVRCRPRWRALYRILTVFRVYRTLAGCHPDDDVGESQQAERPRTVELSAHLVSAALHATELLPFTL